ncbi:hypothetical protein M0R88_06025 [Halorussus gelatinilyticus]|uniref:Uncharacterized protein n=1 Tax=Halorussus gelatinilyticus TaxID=2937524 RepID=A0A8U0ILX8_9EURY|nr:hypothetical protein [Halorussus gelatinilyticus]UPW01655.1 hypothetical protein M0R88_06025 [Halorussus gelatinilyticus]
MTDVDEDVEDIVAQMDGWVTLRDRLDDRDRLEAAEAQAWDSWAHSPSGLAERR